MANLNLENECFSIFQLDFRYNALCCGEYRDFRALWFLATSISRKNGHGITITPRNTTMSVLVWNASALKPIFRKKIHSEFQGREYSSDPSTNNTHAWNQSTRSSAGIAQMCFSQNGELCPSWALHVSRPPAFFPHTVTLSQFRHDVYRSHTSSLDTRKICLLSIVMREITVNQR